MTDSSFFSRKRLTREAGLFLGLLLIGLVLLPIAIYWVGGLVFGAYGGQGFSDFYGALSGKVRAGDPVAWFLILSPYIGCQIIRLMAYLWRRVGRPDTATN